MSRTMGLQIFLAVVFLAGAHVRANPLNRCVSQLVDFQEMLDSSSETTNEELISAFCANQTSFFNCMNSVMKEETGFTVRELADNRFMKGTVHGDFLNNIAKMEDNVKEVCQDKTQLQTTDFSMETICFNPLQSHLSRVSLKHCRRRSVHSYFIFRQLQPEKEFTEEDIKCIITAYQLGCIGETVYDECGVEAFKIFKRIAKSNDNIKSDTCSPDLIKTLKTTFLDSLDMSKSRKKLYRAILELKRRRK